MAPNSVVRYSKAELGAASVAIAFLVLFLIAGALATAFSLSRSVVRDATISAQQVQALFLAESGLARALKRYGNGTPCSGLGPDGPYSLGAGTFSVTDFSTTSGAATDFSGAALSATQCRVQIIGVVSGVARTLEGIMQRSTNGFPPQANVDFNSPAGNCVYPSCTPTNWTFTPAGNWWDDFGGSTLSSPANSRAAYVEKTSPGGGASAQGGGYSFYPPISRSGGQTLTISFDYKNIVNGGANKMSVDFTLYEAGTSRKWSTLAQGTTFKDGNTPGWVTSGTTVSPSYTYTAPASPTITLPSGPTIYINQIDFTLSAGSGMTYKTWLDNIKIDGADTGLTTEEKAVLLSWREVVQ